jgi:hypothetical protein
MRKEQVEKYLVHYITHPPNLDEHELQYFNCLYSSNLDFIRSCSLYELYDKYGLTKFLHFIVYSKRKISI